MADNYAIKGAIKGLMAGLRGVTAGKLAIKRAQTEKARKEAEINLDNKRFNMEQAKDLFDRESEFMKRGRDAMEFENKQADLKTEQDRAEQLHEQQQGIRERLKTADNRYDELFKKSLAATDPAEQESIQAEMEHLKKDRAYLLDRLGEGSSSLEAEIKSESDEASAVAEDKRKEDAAASEHTRTLEADKAAEEKEKADAEVKKQEALAALEANKDAFTEEQYNKIKAQIEIGEDVDITDFTKPPSSADENEHIQAGDDVYEAAIAQGNTPEEAEEKRQEAITESVNSVLGGEGGTEWERIRKRTSEIENEELKTLIQSVVAKGLPARTSKQAMDILVEFAKDGKTEAVYDALGDIWIDASPSKKIFEKRFLTAYMYQEMRIKLQKLEDAGIGTGRVTQAYVDAMGRGDFAAAANEFALEFLDQDYTDDQKRLIGEVHAFISTEFKQFLLTLSGTAASDSEVVMVKSMFPSIHADRSFNTGIVDGHIDSLRKQEFVHFMSESNKEVAAKVMKLKGWDEIKRSTYRDWSKIEDKHKIGIAKIELDAQGGDVEKTIKEFVSYGMDEAEARKLIEGLKEEKKEEEK